MNDTDLRLKVEELVQDKLANGEAFTTADISHPIIKQHNEVRHREVKAIIEDLHARGTMDVEDYTVTTIDVHPDVSKTVKARLWHPDNFDPNEYKGGHKVLVRGDVKAKPTTNALTQTSDDDDDDTDADGTFTVDVHIQSKNPTVNISTKIIKAAGWQAGDRIQITNGGSRLTIERDDNGKQRVDKEGRVRIHGERARTVTTGKAVLDGNKICIS